MEIVKSRILRKARNTARTEREARLHRKTYHTHTHTHTMRASALIFSHIVLGNNFVKNLKKQQTDYIRPTSILIYEVGKKSSEIYS